MTAEREAHNAPQCAGFVRPPAYLPACPLACPLACRTGGVGPPSCSKSAFRMLNRLFSSYRCLFIGWHSKRIIRRSCISFDYNGLHRGLSGPLSMASPSIHLYRNKLPFSAKQRVTSISCSMMFGKQRTLKDRINALEEVLIFLRENLELLQILRSSA